MLNNLQGRRGWTGHGRNLESGNVTPEIIDDTLQIMYASSDLDSTFELDGVVSEWQFTSGQRLGSPRRILAHSSIAGSIV
jgi:hypothetical protein